MAVKASGAVGRGVALGFLLLSVGVTANASSAPTALTASTALTAPNASSAPPASSAPTALTASTALAAPPASSALTAPPGTELRISIMTMGVGAHEWERFGHNAIVVEDRIRGTAIAYNYGMFSFRQDDFVLRFVQGRMLYWMADIPAADELPRYVAARRSVWRQHLNLTPEERVALRDFLEWNARPENRFYRYDYYRDNCSTRVRDALDRILGGALREQNQGPASGTYRFHTLRLNTHNVPLYLGLLLATGQGADAPATRWDEMFLPLALREYLAQAQRPDSAGTLVPLVAAEDTLYLSDAYPVPAQPPHWAGRFLGAGVLLGGVLGAGGVLGRRRRWARIGFLTLAGCYALLTGILGTVLAGLWAFTDHAIASRNENVLQCTLFALALGLLLPFAAGRPGVGRAVRGLALAVAGLALLGLVLKLLPGFSQDNWQLLALLVPANLGLAAGVVGSRVPVAGAPGP